MAATVRAVGLAVTWGSAKSMIDMFNATGSARIMRMFRAYIFNNGTTAVTAALSAVRVNRTTAASGGTTITPVAHDTNSAALDANTTFGTGRTITRTDNFRQILYLLEEPTTTGTTQANWEVLVPNAEIWNAGYGDTTIEPIVCRAVQGVEIQNSGAGAVSTADLELECTDAAT